MGNNIEVIVSDNYTSFKNIYGEPTDNIKLKNALEKADDIIQLDENELIQLENNRTYYLTIHYGVRFILPNVSGNCSVITIFLDSRTSDNINFGTNCFINKDYPMTSEGTYIVKYINTSKQWVCSVSEFGEV